MSVYRERVRETRRNPRVRAKWVQEEYMVGGGKETIKELKGPRFQFRDQELQCEFCNANVKRVFAAPRQESFRSSWPFSRTLLSVHEDEEALANERRFPNGKVFGGIAVVESGITKRDLRRGRDAKDCGLELRKEKAGKNRDHRHSVERLERKRSEHGQYHLIPPKLSTWLLTRPNPALGCGSARPAKRPNAKMAILDASFAVYRALLDCVRCSTLPSAPQAHSDVSYPIPVASRRGQRCQRLLCPPSDGEIPILQAIVDSLRSVTRVDRSGEGGGTMSAVYTLSTREAATDVLFVYLLPGTSAAAYYPSRRVDETPAVDLLDAFDALRRDLSPAMLLRHACALGLGTLLEESPASCATISAAFTRSRRSLAPAISSRPSAFLNPGRYFTEAAGTSPALCRTWSFDDGPSVRPLWYEVEFQLSDIRLPRLGRGATSAAVTNDFIVGERRVLRIPMSLLILSCCDSGAPPQIRHPRSPRAVSWCNALVCLPGAPELMWDASYTHAARFEQKRRHSAMHRRGGSIVKQQRSEGFICRRATNASRSGILLRVLLPTQYSKPSVLPRLFSGPETLAARDAIPLRAIVMCLQMTWAVVVQTRGPPCAWWNVHRGRIWSARGMGSTPFVEDALHPGGDTSCGARAFCTTVLIRSSLSGAEYSIIRPRDGQGLGRSFAGRECVVANSIFTSPFWSSAARHLHRGADPRFIFNRDGEVPAFVLGGEKNFAAVPDPRVDLPNATRAAIGAPQLARAMFVRFVVRSLLVTRCRYGSSGECHAPLSFRKVRENKYTLIDAAEAQAWYFGNAQLVWCLVLRSAMCLGT
ncbi:hypothetical protein C8R47DRAFT_1082759 [Mycena vitilis]|nr:hypothetical protein C8R47DRAFT_1082759 [Mycena vitilis]